MGHSLLDKLNYIFLPLIGSDTGHHTDMNYNNVILHVVYINDLEIEIEGNPVLHFVFQPEKFSSKGLLEPFQMLSL